MDAAYLTNQIFVNPAEPIEERALTFFLTAMIVEPQSTGRSVGHLELVPRLYLQSLSTSALAKVTTAMSMSAFCVVGTDATIVRQRAYQAYGDAVTGLWRALRDDKERAKNETLLACVLMVVVESLLSGGKAPSQQWSNHVGGASELLRQRGWDKMLKDPVARRLFSVVRSFLSWNPESDLAPSDMFYHEVPVAPDIVIPPETRLGNLTKRVADLRRRAFAELTRPILSKQAIASIVAECREIDQEFINWNDSLPEVYRYTLVDSDDLAQQTISISASTYIPASQSSPSSTESSEPGLLPSQLHRYPDPFLQRLWNSYRIGRIYVNAIIHRASNLSFASATPQFFSDDAPSLAASTTKTLAALAGAILASIPPHILHPERFPRDSTMVKAAEIGLAYYCLWPLYIARGIVTLPAEARWHMREVMGRIVYRYEIRHGLDLMRAGDAAVVVDGDGVGVGGVTEGGRGGGGREEECRISQIVVDGGGTRPLWGGPWKDDWMESVWEWTFLYGCGAI